MERIEIINQWKINRIFSELENGNMRIPRFQRAYVWERSKIVKLLNSIYCQYPIGSFFLWDTDKSMEGLCRDLSEFGFQKTPEANKFSFILDGQQRITSLYVALKGCVLKNIDYKTICFNLDKKIFKVPNLKTEPNNIPVWKIFNDIEYANLLKEYYTQGLMEYGALIQDCHNRLIEYPVSIIKSFNMNLDEVVTIFERINQGGKRLTLFDLVHASVWSDNFDLREKIKQFNEEAAITIFGAIDEEIFTQALALNIDNDCSNRHQLNLKNEECANVWERTIECLRLAIDYVKQLGVQKYEIIPYPAQLPIIQYYYYISTNKTIDADTKQKINEWFWTSSFAQRYSSSTLTKMNEDALWIRRIVNGAQENRCFTVKLNVNDLLKIRMNNRSVIKNAILCLMALNSPVDFDNGDSVSLDKTNASRSNSKENHHFFPYSLQKIFGVATTEINSVLNFAFITKRLNLEISNKYPSKYLTAYLTSNPNILRHLQSHFITKEALDKALKDDFSGFINQRGATILDKINEICAVNKKDIVSIDDNEVVDEECDND